MMEEKKLAGEVLDEKYEERGWNEDPKEIEKRPTVEKLDLTEEEYIAYAHELATKAIENEDPELASEYFELQRRAVYGNRYGVIKDLEEAEEIMWNLGIEEKQEDIGPKLH